MDISGISDKLNENTASAAKSKIETDEFEKRLKNAMDKKDDTALKQVCKDFEGIFLNMMYKQMKATVPKSELLSSDPGTDTFNSMLDDKLMEEASKSNSVGMADVLYKQLSKQLKSTYKVDDKGEVAGVEEK